MSKTGKSWENEAWSCLVAPSSSAWLPEQMAAATPLTRPALSCVTHGQLHTCCVVFTVTMRASYSDRNIVIEVDNGAAIQVPGYC